MSGFEFLFSFYGLLLGLAVANVTSSFADTWRRRGNWHIGIIPLLLGLLILLSAAQQWASFWAARDGLTMTPSALLMSLGMALPYIFVSHAMFPADLHDGGSLDAHYFEQCPILLGTLLVPPILSLTYNLALGPLPTTLDDILLFGLGYAPRIIIPAAMLVWRQRWVQVSGFFLLCAWMLVLILV